MRRTFTVIDIVEILTHWYAGRSVSEVARSLGVDRATVAKYIAPAKAEGLAPGGPPISEEAWRAKIRLWFPGLYDTRLRRPSWDAIAVHHERIEKLLGVVPASVIHQRLADEEGLQASVASLRRYLRAHFDGQQRSGEVEIWRPSVAPGEEAQVDYGYLGSWCDPTSGRRRRVWAFSMVLSYSRHLFVYPVLCMDQSAWVAAHVAAFEFFGGAPKRVVLDNLKAGVIKPDIYDPKLNRAYVEMAEHYGVLLDPARAGKPKDKPRIESVQRYIKTSFFAGKAFPNYAALVSCGKRWSSEVAGKRCPRSLEGRSVLEVFTAEEQGKLAPLPETAFELARWSCPKVGPDAHVRVGKTLYSVPYRLIGARLDARLSGEYLQLFRSGELIKTHPCQERGRRTDWSDLPAERTGFFMRTPTWCGVQARIVGPACEALIGELLAVNALFRLRSAQGVLRLAERHGVVRLEAACRRALEVGDPAYRTVKGILDAGTENEGIQPSLPGIQAPAFLRGPAAFAGEEL